jgi:hypothetical protein
MARTRGRVKSKRSSGLLRASACVPLDTRQLSMTDHLGRPRTTVSTEIAGPTARSNVQGRVQSTEIIFRAQRSRETPKFRVVHCVNRRETRRVPTSRGVRQSSISVGHSIRLKSSCDQKQPETVDSIIELFLTRQPQLPKPAEE